MLTEFNEAGNYLKQKFPDGNAPDGVYAIPTDTSKGPAFMRLELKNNKSFGGNNFSLFWDEALTVSWYTNPKPEFPVEV